MSETRGKSIIMANLGVFVFRLARPPVSLSIALWARRDKCGTKIEHDFIMSCFFGNSSEGNYIPREKPLYGSTA